MKIFGILVNAGTASVLILGDSTISSLLYADDLGRTDNCVKINEKPRVTHGMVLRETYLELLMGSFYVSTATTYSWYGFT